MRSALERRQEILEALSDRRFETVQNLATEFDVSVRTIKYDLEYQADNDGAWGEFTLDEATGELRIITLADLDTIKTHRCAKQAARYLMTHAGEKLPKRVLVAFE